MQNEITKGKDSMLPAKTQDALNALRQSPEKYYDALTPIKADESLTDETPTLAQIQRGLGAPGAKLAVSVALLELSEWFNVQKNLTDRQIAMIAEMIIEVHWDLSLNEIKGVFRDKMRNAKLYGKLDGSDIMGWLDDYKQESMAAVQAIRDAEAYDFSQSSEAIGYEEWSKRIPEGENYIAKGFKNVPVVTPEQHRQKDLDFYKWKIEYLKSKGITPK